MLYIEQTQKSVDQASHDLEASIKQHGFGLLHHYDFKQSLREKGFELPNEGRNPQSKEGSWSFLCRCRSVIREM